MNQARALLAVFWFRFRTVADHRLALFTSFLTQLWFGAVRIMIIVAFDSTPRHEAASNVQTLAHAISYVWIAQAFRGLLPLTADPEIVWAINNGGISYDRLRPVGIYKLWLARSLGWVTARTLPRSALMALATGLGLPLFGLSAWAWKPPPDIQATVLFLVSLSLGILLSCLLVIILNAVVLATFNPRGVEVLVLPVVTLFTGSVLPLNLFPSDMQWLMVLQPFASIIDIPIRLYAERYTPGASCLLLLVQLGWICGAAGGGGLYMRWVLGRLEARGE